jgi:hypothetical protein
MRSLGFGVIPPRPGFPGGLGGEVIARDQVEHEDDDGNPRFACLIQSCSSCFNLIELLNDFSLCYTEANTLSCWPRLKKND